MIDQLTVYLENKPGELQRVCSVLGEADIQMQALMIADTEDFGIVRIVCNRPRAALATLREQGFSAAITPVLAAQVPHTPGGLSSLLGLLDTEGVNVEYAYCFANGIADHAVVVLKVSSDQLAQAEGAFAKAGFVCVDRELVHVCEE